MSLTSLISRDFRGFFQEIVPSKKDFKTLSGKTAFSKSDYKEYAECKLENPHDSTVVGIAFDYLARWIIAKTVDHEKENSYLYLVAEDGVEPCEMHIKATKDSEVGSIRKKYDEGIKNVERFVNGAYNKDKIIETAIFFAKLEPIGRGFVALPLIDINKLLKAEKKVFEDLVRLTEVFQIKMIDSGIIGKNSIVIYNPTFGGASYLCGGADADVYVDGTLYDFKCTKKVGYNWTEIAQILGYYLLDTVSKNNNDPSNELEEHKIKRIALYKARYGEIEYYDIQEKDYEKVIEKFEEMLGKEEYQNYLEEFQREENEYNEEVLREENIDCELKRVYVDFYSKINAMKSAILSFAKNRLALNIDGDDIYMRIEYEKGFEAIFDELDYSPYFNLDEYNEECFEQLYLASVKDKDNIVSNFFIPLFGDNFSFSFDKGILGEEYENDYQNVIFVIRTDTINYIFTNDI